MKRSKVFRLSGRQQPRRKASLGVSQPSVAKIEKQADMYLSTLRSYVEAAGGKLELVVHLKDGPTVQLNGLSDMPRAAAKTGKTRTRSDMRPRP